MRIAIFLFPLLIFLLAISPSCSKSSDVTPGNDSTALVDPTLPPVANTWQCTIDGKAYSGVIDTSFTQNFFNSNSVDTIIVAAGTSQDKKTHVLFNVAMNRRNFPATGVNLVFNSFFVFDTSTFNRATSYISGNPSINYKIDTVNSTKVVISYSGTLTDRSGQHSFTGKFTCALNTGNNEPNRFLCQLELSKQSGYFINSCFSANTLILNGMYYRDLAHKSFRLLVRTGSTISPGTYKSSDGDVSLYAVEPGFSGNSYYIDDTSGSATVVIESVSGNIVRGSFSGTNKNGNRVQSGTFVCRVPNYTPQNNAANRWAFSAWVDPAFAVYECYAGNVLSAIKTTSNGRNYLTINGESDNGKSAFKIVISSTSPIIRGTYELNGFPDNVVDTVYFKSGVTTWDGTIPRLWADLSTFPVGDGTAVYISSIDNNNVSGIFYNRISNNLDNVNFQGSASRIIQKAKFNASF